MPKNRKPKRNKKTILSAVTKGTIIALISALTLFVLFSLLISKEVLSEEMLPSLIVISTAIASAAGGLCGAISAPKNKAPTALTCAFCYIALLLAIAALWGIEEQEKLEIWKVLLSGILPAAIAGVAAGNRKGKTKTAK